jgi:hypothetical protein
MRFKVCVPVLQWTNAGLAAWFRNLLIGLAS